MGRNKGVSQRPLGHNCCHSADVIVEWVTEHPALEGCQCIDDVIALCRTGDDPAVAALLRRAQSGCSTAGECVLAAMGPGLERFARRDNAWNLDSYLSEGWLVLMNHPSSRTHKILINLVWDTRKRLHRQERLMPVDPMRLEQRPLSACGNGNGGPSARSVIAMASRLQLVPPASIEVLTSVYAEGLSGREAATKHRITEEMVRYRCSSSLKRMRARSDLLAAA